MRRSQHRRWTKSATCLKSERTLPKSVNTGIRRIAIRLPLYLRTRTLTRNGQLVAGAWGAPKNINLLMRLVVNLLTQQ